MGFLRPWHTSGTLPDKQTQQNSRAKESVLTLGCAAVVPWAHQDIDNCLFCKDGAFAKHKVMYLKRSAMFFNCSLLLFVATSICGKTGH
jgi:hypothetical protein